MDSSGILPDYLLTAGAGASLSCSCRFSNLHTQQPTAAHLSLESSVTVAVEGAATAECVAFGSHGPLTELTGPWLAIAEHRAFNHSLSGWWSFSLLYPKLLYCLMAYLSQKQSSLSDLLLKY